MSATIPWVWGWELGTTALMYQQTGWVLLGNFDVADLDPFQPASGFGGGRFNFRGSSQRFNGGGRAETPGSGENSIGVHQVFAFHTAYKRVNVTGWDFGAALLRFLSGVTEVVSLRHGNPNDQVVSPIALYVNNVLIGTSTTTYTNAQPYHRIVLDLNGATGDYDVYINGILEISVSGSLETFVSIDRVEFLGGANGNPGGRHDHCVLSTNPAADLALLLGDIFIQGLQPNADVVDGSWLNVNGVNDGTNVDLYANIADGAQLTEFIETLTSPDAYEVAHENRAAIDPGWAPSSVHNVQAIQIARASGTISQGRVTIDSAGIVKHTSANKTLGAAGIMVNECIDWTGNATTDVDDIRTGLEV